MRHGEWPEEAFLAELRESRRKKNETDTVEMSVYDYVSRIDDWRYMVSKLEWEYGKDIAHEVLGTL